jgi:hypothetical protein
VLHLTFKQRWKNHWLVAGTEHHVYITHIWIIEELSNENSIHFPKDSPEESF